MEKIRRVLIVILLLAALLSGTLVILNYIGRMKEAKEYEKLAEIVQTEEPTEPSEEETETEPEPETEEEPYVSPIDFDKLKSMNEDTIGWIQVPDTPIDYPILQGEDNEQYLHMDFDKKESVAGAIFLDCDSSPDMKGRNNLLYGHHMKNGSMFKALVKYKDKEYFENHPYFTIYTPEETIHLRVISAYYASADGAIRQTKFRSLQSFNEFVDWATAKCPYRVELEGNLESIYILVTCSYEFKDARTFVIAAPADEDGNIIYSEETEEKTEEAEETPHVVSPPPQK